MSYLTTFTYKPDCEIAFNDLKSAQNFLLKELINKLKNSDSFLVRPSSTYNIRYVQSLDEYNQTNIENTKKNLDYKKNVTNFMYNPDNINTIYHPTIEKMGLMKTKSSKYFDVNSALCKNSELKNEYKEAYEHMLSLLPKQHAEIDKTITWLKDFDKKYPNRERDGPGPNTIKYSSKDLELPVPE